jgi:hypothetical protein
MKSAKNIGIYVITEEQLNMVCHAFSTATRSPVLSNELRTLAGRCLRHDRKREHCAGAAHSLSACRLRLSYRKLETTRTLDTNPSRYIATETTLRRATQK